MERNNKCFILWDTVTCPYNNTSKLKEIISSLVHECYKYDCIPVFNAVVQSKNNHNDIKLLHNFAFTIYTDLNALCALGISQNFGMNLGSRFIIITGNDSFFPCICSLSYKRNILTVYYPNSYSMTSQSSSLWKTKSFSLLYENYERSQSPVTRRYSRERSKSPRYRSSQTNKSYDSSYTRYSRERSRSPSQTTNYSLFRSQHHEPLYDKYTKECALNLVVKNHEKIPNLEVNPQTEKKRIVVKKEKNKLNRNIKQEGIESYVNKEVKISDNIICSHYNKGNCTKNEKCNYVHHCAKCKVTNSNSDSYCKKCYPEKISQLPIVCPHSFFCVHGTKCKNIHMPVEIKCFELNNNIGITKYKAKPCKNMVMHDRDICNFSHNISDTKCYKCGKFGHISKVCPNNPY